ncbi:MAG: cysteine--tRNA ligase [Patescibacteria group bacterium]
MELKLYNTLTRQKDAFKPLKRGKVGVYSCGPTVYNYAHIGNLRAYIFADILKRALVYNGYKVNHVMNITDVGHLTSDADSGEDKLEKGAAREGKTVWDVARFYEDAFKQDVAKLNILPPDVYCRATEHIAEQVKMIKKIIKHGYTYQTSQALYFDTSKVKDYTALSGQKLGNNKTGARQEVEVDPEKKQPADFVLWFKLVGKYANHVMHWPSPWGQGFPGWHIECSAMSIKYLGDKFDIHTGGIDHIAVHHTNERAQNLAATGHEVVARWLHNEFLVIGGGDKMAKSGENFITLQSLIDKGIDPLAYRYFCLGTHYRKQLNFSWEALNSAQSGLDNLREQVSELRINNYPSTSLGAGELRTKDVNKFYEDKFLAALNDDLNMSQALAVLQEVLRSDLDLQQKLATILDFDQVLGLELAKIEKIEIPVEVKKLAEERLEARQNKDWVKSDELRKKIEKFGYLVEDSKDGYQIKKSQ